MADPDDAGPLLPGEPVCAYCVTVKPIYHVHRNGRTPQTPCKECLEGRHMSCEPEPYWCGCSHEFCIARTL